MVQRIKEIAKVKCGSNTQLAISVGISPRTAEKMFSGKGKVSLSFVEAILLRYPDISAEWLLRGKGSMLSEPGSAVSVRGNIVGSNVASSDCTVDGTSGLLEYMEHLNALLMQQRVDYQQRIKELNAALNDKRAETTRLYKIIDGK